MISRTYTVKITHKTTKKRNIKDCLTLDTDSVPRFTGHTLNVNVRLECGEIGKKRDGLLRHMTKNHAMIFILRSLVFNLNVFICLHRGAPCISNVIIFER